jgi:hypothetical protein
MLIGKGDRERKKEAASERHIPCESREANGNDNQQQEMVAQENQRM